MKAIVLGATGLVGNELLQLMEEDARFEKIELISRRELELKEMKVVNHVVDFDQLKSLPIEGPCDVLFIAFGTTLKTAGSKKTQWKIDVDIPTKVMKLAREIGVKQCVLISALGVSERSPFFYSRMKATLDKNARDAGFDKLIILKPSVLEGFRKDERMGEKISVAIGNLLGKTRLIDKYKPVQGMKVAQCMIQSLIELPDGYHEIHSGLIHSYAKRFKPQPEVKSE
jgi:uncharacterized protein YbjT (DUF2867 family)